MAPGNDRGTILTFAIIALLILGMAVVNFTNLATARASQRAREVALRKVLGANRAPAHRPVHRRIDPGRGARDADRARPGRAAAARFSAFLDADIELDYFGAERHRCCRCSAWSCSSAGWAASIRPSSCRASSRRRCSRPTSRRPRRRHRAAARRALVVGQFAVSIGLIICTAVIYGQTVYARTVDPGYRARRTSLQIDELSRYQLIDKGEAIADRIEAGAGGPGGRPERRSASPPTATTTPASWCPGNPEPVIIGTLPGRRGLPRTRWASSCVAGRWFDEQPADGRHDDALPADPEQQRALGGARRQRRRQRARRAQRLGFADPADAVGKTAQGGAGRATRSGSCRSRSSESSTDSRFRSVREPLDADHVLSTPNAGHHAADRPLQRRSARDARQLERVWQQHHHRSAVRGRFQRGHRRRALRGGGCAGEDLRRLRLARGRRRLPRPVRPRRLHRRAADQGDRNPQGARRAHRATSSACSPGNSPSR